MRTRMSGGVGRVTGNGGPYPIYAFGFQALPIDQAQRTARMLSRYHYEEPELWQADT